MSFNRPKKWGREGTFLSIHPCIISKLTVPGTWITARFQGVRGSQRCPAVP